MSRTYVLSAQPYPSSVLRLWPRSRRVRLWVGVAIQLGGVLALLDQFWPFAGA